MDAVPRRELPAWLWCWLPWIPVVAMVGAYYTDRDFHERWFNQKEGPLEWGTVLVLLPALWAGVLVFRRRRLLPGGRIRAWVLLVALGSLYYAGEEISWGQQVWHWETPEGFRDVNRQQETNLHNTSGWFNEKPKLLLELWVLVGGIVVAWRNRRRDPLADAGDWRTWFWPTWVCFPTSVITIVMRLPDRAEKLFGKFETGLLADLRLSEPQELYFGVFLMLYLLSCAVRLGRLERESAGSG